MTTDSYDEELLRMIRAAVAEELDHRTRIDAETHYQHHQAVAEWVQCSQQRRDLLVKVAQHVIGWGSVLGIGWLGKSIWDAAVASARVLP